MNLLVSSDANRAGAFAKLLFLRHFLPVLVDMPRGCLIEQEETFGPVAALYKFETEEEALELCNASEVGLAMYVYTNDYSRMWRFGEALESGMVGINTGVVSSTVIPFGGVSLISPWLCFFDDEMTDSPFS